MNKRLVFFGTLVLILLVYGFRQAIFVAPTEVTMGEIQRIFYYHVSSAMVAFTCFFANLVASLAYLKSRSPRADAWAAATAEVGVVFCSVVLVTGPLWARPVWGVWWTWDARLTSTLLLWLIYISYLLLRRFSAPGQAAVLSAALAIFGSLDVVFVYMSIRWFRTTHPQPVMGPGGGGLDPAMGRALLVNFIAFLSYATLIAWQRFGLERRAQLVEERHALRPAGGTQ